MKHFWRTVAGTTEGVGGSLAGLAAAAVCLLAAAGCADSSAVDRSKPAKEEKGGVDSWNWSEFMEVDRMRLGSVPCQLLPKATITLQAPLAGILRVHLDEPQTNLSAGDIWAEYEPEIFAAEEDALMEAKRKLEDREKLQLQLELPREKIRLNAEIEEARRQLKLLTLLSTNEVLANATFRHGGESLVNPMKPDALTNAQVRLRLLEETLDYLLATNLIVLGVDLEGQQSEWQRRKLEFDRRRAQAQLKMPFKGQLTVSLPLTEGLLEYPVSSGQELAVARDLSRIRVRLALSNPAWSGWSGDRLTALVRRSGGGPLRASYIYNKIERNQGRDESAYYFEFPVEQSDAAVELMGTDVGCELWVQLPRRARIVPKLKLVLRNPEAFQGKSWQAGVAELWPGAEVIAEGQTELAIAVGEEGSKG